MKSYSSNFQQLDQLTREVKLIDEDMKRVMVSDIQSLLVNEPMSKPWLTVNVTISMFGLVENANTIGHFQITFCLSLVPIL